jgi:hypothetical protein
MRVNEKIVESLSPHGVKSFYWEKKSVNWKDRQCLVSGMLNIGLCQALDEGAGLGRCWLKDTDF